MFGENCALAGSLRALQRPARADVDAVWPLARVRAEADRRRYGRTGLGLRIKPLGDPPRVRQDQLLDARGEQDVLIKVVEAESATIAVFQ